MRIIPIVSLSSLLTLSARPAMKRSLVLSADKPSPKLEFETPLVKSSRVRALNDKKLPSENSGQESVVMWMQRDQRVNDNYAMLYANALSRERGWRLIVVFTLEDDPLQTLRHHKFLLGGLKEVEKQLRDRHIPFYLLHGDAVRSILTFADQHHARAVVTDFSPLRKFKRRYDAVAAAFAYPLLQVDAHNIVPVWVASDKLEYGARTIRPKISNRLNEYVLEFPPLETSLPASNLDGCEPVQWGTLLASIVTNRDVDFTDRIDCLPGESEGQKMVQQFIDSRMKNYGEKRNDPNVDAVSHLSPYFNFGQISVQRVVMQVRQAKKFPSSADSFIEEAVIRRELSDNFCYYNANYDNLTACYPWAAETLRVHASDPRKYVYSLEVLETSQTHDDLWNAAQTQLTTTGKMHGTCLHIVFFAQALYAGFLRMYWAKKILEWTRSPEEALEFAIILNDKYALDGTDPNGYVGIMWSIGGIHDQGWGERPVFGKIRYMNYEGCKRKFDVKAFVKKYSR